MATRFAQLHTNINYKNNDIFNTSYNAPVALLETRDAKFPRPRYTQKANRSISRDHTNSIEQSFGRLHTWDQKEISMDDTEYFTALNKNMLRSSQQATSNGLPDRSKGNNNTSDLLTQSLNIQPQTLSTQGDIQGDDLAMARSIWGDFIKQREEYKKDLEKQISEKNQRKEIEKVVALSTVLSGLPIGEIHSGFDVDVCTRNLVVRERAKKHPNFFEKRTASLTTQVPFEDSREQKPEVNQQKENNLLNVIKVEEETEAEGSSGKVLKTEPVPKSKNKDQGQFAEYLENTTNSRFHVKKVFHQKLREYIEQHNKKCEEYTAKLLRDQQQAKKSWGQQIQNQIATKAAKKKADAFRDQKQERGDLKMKINIGGESRAPGPTEKSALLLRIAEKHEMSQKKQDTQHIPSSVRQKALEMSGRYQRLVDDTVKQLLKKNAHLLEKNQK